MRLALTHMQRRKIREIQTRSFAAFCARCGYDETAHSKVLLGAAREKIRLLIGDVSLADMPDRSATHARELLAAKDFLSLRDADLEYHRLAYAEYICEVAHLLPIDYEYVRRLCQRLGLAESTPNNPELARELVEAVPLISNWDFAFQAFVTSRPLVDDTPCICIYELLLAACDVFLHCVAPAAIAFGDKARPASVDRSRAIGSDGAFMQQLGSCIELALGRRNDVVPGDSEADPKAYFTVHAMVDGSIQAVWLHEFGHLLQGHLEQAECHRVEFEADRFAFTAMSAARDRGLWHGLGGLTTLVLLHIMETATRRVEDHTHPSGSRRLAAALELVRSASPELYAVAGSYLPALAAACSPTLKKHWGFSLNYTFGS
jgi:hypothetical protein